MAKYFLTLYKIGEKITILNKIVDFFGAARVSLQVKPFKFLLN